jgi:hypothetical protein
VAAPAEASVPVNAVMASPMMATVPARTGLAAAGRPPDGHRRRQGNRYHAVRYNASTRSHAELDEAPDLDEGDIGLLAGRHRQLAADLPALAIVGGCCGTDARHVEALWT